MTQKEYEVGLTVISEISRHLPSNISDYVKAYKEHYIENNKGFIGVEVKRKGSKKE